MHSSRAAVMEQQACGPSTLHCKIDTLLSITTFLFAGTCS